MDHGKRKVYSNYQRDTEKLITVVYRNRNNMYLKNWKEELKTTEYEKLLY